MISIMRLNIDCLIHIFADDTNLLIFENSLKALQTKDLKFVYHWLNANK